jgi:type I restriction enzyme S subunit
MASRGDIKFEEVQPKLCEKWLKLDFEATLDKTGSFTKLKSKDYFDEGKFPVIDQGDSFISGYINDEELLYQGELPVIIFGDHTRVVKFIDFQFATGADGTKVLKPLEFFDSMFYFYYLKSLKIPSLGYSRHFKILKAVKVPLPPLAEQQRIVTKLDELFEHLETLKTRLNNIPQLLKNFRQAVLTQAVTGKLTEEWREGKELNNYSNKQLCELREKEGAIGNTKLIESGRRKQRIQPFTWNGLNNIGWAQVNVESAAIFIIDCLHSTPKFELKGEYLIDTTCITPFKVHWEKARRINKEYYEKWVTRLEPKYGDILFSREGTIGIGVKVPKEKRICIGQRMMLFRFGSYILPEFSEVYLNSMVFKDEFRPHIKGVAAQHLNIGDIRKLNFPIPSINEQTEIMKRVELLFSKVDNIESQYQSLKTKIDNLPQAILAKAFKGELVEQLPTDGYAKELLEEIKRLKTEAIKSKTKRNKK